MIQPGVLTKIYSDPIEIYHESTKIYYDPLTRCVEALLVAATDVRLEIVPEVLPYPSIMHLMFSSERGTTYKVLRTLT